MSKLTFGMLALLGFVLATLAIGIRGVENWAPYEFTLYFGLLGWGAHMAYRRHIVPGVQ